MTDGRFTSPLLQCVWRQSGGKTYLVRADLSIFSDISLCLSKSSYARFHEWIDALSLRLCRHSLTLYSKRSFPFSILVQLRVATLLFPVLKHRKLGPLRIRRITSTNEKFHRWCTQTRDSDQAICCTYRNMVLCGTQPWPFCCKPLGGSVVSVADHGLRGREFDTVPCAPVAQWGVAV